MVYCYDSANWASIKNGLRNTDWEWMANGDINPDSAAERLTNTILSLVHRFTSMKESVKSKSDVSWFNDECLRAIQERNLAEGTDNYEAAATKCNKVFMGVYGRYQNKMRNELLVLPRGSKKWWKLSDRLLSKPTRAQSIPALKVNSEWITEPGLKANAFLQCFSSKWVLPMPLDGSIPPDYIELPPEWIPFIRPKAIAEALSNLDPTTSTGIDGLSAQVLKTCSKELVRPLVMLIRLIFITGHWPECWCIHRLTPIFKRKAVFDPNNYRGVHITSQLGKTVERVILGITSRFYEETPLDQINLRIENNMVRGIRCFILFYFGFSILPMDTKFWCYCRTLPALLTASTEIDWCIVE